MVIRVAAAQLNVVVGDLEANSDAIIAALARAEEAQADVCVFSELSITGYPPEDLLCKERFIDDNLRALEKIAKATSRCAAVVGYVARAPQASAGPALYNAAALCHGGHVVATYAKHRLPNYAVFDEVRWFREGKDDPQLFLLGGAVVGLSICEDVWEPEGPVAALGRAGAQVVLNLNASPYSRGRRSQRLTMLTERVGESGAAIVYVNQVGGQDELVFDGASMVVDQNGQLVASGAQFAPDFFVVDLLLHESVSPTVPVHEISFQEQKSISLAPHLTPALTSVAEVYDALVMGTRDYIEKNGFAGALLGLSGGIDSALVATIAVDALGKDRVRAFALPSRFSSVGSKTDAQAVADNLGIALDEIALERAHHALSEMLAPALGHAPSGLTTENLQSRLRGLLLMAVSNDSGWIVLTTGNKSEMATGYSTLYGDSAGGFAVIKDVPKTLVYDLCHYRNERSQKMGEVAPIPTSIIEKPPSAELRPDQRDDQSLPPYEVLDPILAAYVEEDLSVPELISLGYDEEMVTKIASLVDRSEYKRRQMPPGVRITTKAFGKDRRMPITNHYGRG